MTPSTTAPTTAAPADRRFAILDQHGAEIGSCMARSTQRMCGSGFDFLDAKGNLVATAWFGYAEHDEHGETVSIRHISRSVVARLTQEVPA